MTAAEVDKIRLARIAVKAALRWQGVKVSSIPAKDITKIVRDAIAQHATMNAMLERRALERLIG